MVVKFDRLASEADLINRLSKEGAGNRYPGLLFADLHEVDATNAAGRMILGKTAQDVQSKQNASVREIEKRWPRPNQEV